MISEKNDKKNVFLSGIRAGFPIGLGYLAVSFSLGIAAKNAGLSYIQAFFSSLLCNASAGEYAGFTVISAGSAYIEMFFITAIVNARYMLMSCAMSQRMDPNTKFIHRLFMSWFLTDEIFAVSMSRLGYLKPYYTYGVAVMCSPFWAIGTALGAIAGNLLPINVVSALSVSLYGMFIAVTVPPAKKNKIIFGLIVVCFLLSGAFSYIPVINSISSGSRIIILTVIISAVAAVIFPHDDSKEIL